MFRQAATRRAACIGDLFKRHGDIGTHAAAMKKRFEQRSKAGGIIRTVLALIADIYPRLSGKLGMNIRGFTVGNGIADDDKVLGHRESADKQ